MSWLSNLTLGGLKVARGVGKFAIGGSLQRAILGAGIGGVYNAFTTDKNDPNQYLGSISRGAIVGGVLGGMGPRMASSLAKNIFTKRNFSQLRTAGNILGSGAGLALKYPTIAAGIGLGAYALTNNTSPYTVRNRQRMMNSTNGLVQGLHSSRHS